MPDHLQVADHAQDAAGQPIGFVSSKDKETAKQFLEYLSLEEMPPFLDFALNEASRTNFDVQTLGGIRPYLASYLAARERQATGRRVVGRRGVLRQSWRDSPMSREPRRGLRPRIASRNMWLRIAALQRNKEWQAEYRSARALMLAGFDVEFPHGTYWLRRFANVRVAAPPLPAN